MSLPNVPRGGRKIPAPFQRNAIRIGTPPEARREWRWVPPQEVQPGDNVPGLGMVTRVELEHRSVLRTQEVDGIESADVLDPGMVKLYGPPDNDTEPFLVLPLTGVVWAFTKRKVARGGDVGPGPL